MRNDAVHWNYARLLEEHKKGTLLFGYWQLSLDPSGDILLSMRQNRGTTSELRVTPQDEVLVKLPIPAFVQYHEARLIMHLTNYIIQPCSRKKDAKVSGYELYEPGGAQEKPSLVFGSEARLKIKPPSCAGIAWSNEPFDLSIDGTALKDVRTKYQALRRAVRAREKLGFDFRGLVNANLAKRGPIKYDANRADKIHARVVKAIRGFVATEEWTTGPLVDLMGDLCELRGQSVNTGGRWHLGWPGKNWNTSNQLTAVELVEHWWRTNRKDILLKHKAATWTQRTKK